MTPITILIDADACPVKDEIYRVADRFRAEVRVVSNAPDDWIAEAADARSVVITADILLADRCLKAGARVLKHNGEAFTAASIGGAIATRAIMADLRAGMDGVGGGPAPFSKADRSRFLQALDRVLVGMGRG